MSPTSLLRSLNFSASQAAGSALGDLPAWKLSDLYPSATSPAFLEDMEKAGRMAIAFEEKWKGKLTDAAAKSGDAGIGAAIREYEAGHTGGARRRVKVDPATRTATDVNE